MNDRTNLYALIAFLTFVLIMIVSVSYISAIKDIKMANQGYEQILEGNHFLWKKIQK